MTTPTEFLAEVLKAASMAAAEVFTEHGFESEEYAFALTLWPIGKPEYCSSVIASSTGQANREAPEAFGEAQRKAVTNMPIQMHERRRGDA